MSDVADHFVFLDLQANALEETQLLTRPVGLMIGSQHVLVGLDAARQKHLLIPVKTMVDGDNASQGVALESRVLRVDSVDVTFADLHCRMSSLGLVFERLVEDVLNRLAEDDSSPVTTCRKVLDEWRALLRTAGQRIARETVVGLVGELEVLRLLALHNPSGAIDCWDGPSGSLHDFARGGAHLEVKTTTSVDGNYVAISNIDQLDPRSSETLHLVVVHAREDAAAPQLDERIDHLIDLGVPREALITKVADAGYVYESGLQLEDRYRIRSVRAWLVGDSFPGLRRAEIGEARLKGVSRVRYELALDAAPRRLSDEELKTLLGAWVNTP